ncbi:MAG: class I SAM-dependent RNA methyltransferase [Bacilli bacterium]|nr:class I SAM-dependent RNA methyltransferase [Bacilli bacterium]
MYEITSLNDQGLGICYVNDKITFVSNTLIGDVVKLKIVKEHTKYNEAIVTRFLKNSPSKIKAKCPYFDKCGGCVLQNVNYNETLNFKKNKLQNILHKFAKIDVDVDIISSPKEFFYRNKISLKIKDSKIGYYSYGSNTLVEIKECIIASKAINEFIKEIPKFNIRNGEIVLRNNYNDELLIHIITNDDINIFPLDNYKVVGIIKNNELLKGEDHFIDIIDNKLFQVSYDSFFQVNREVASYIFKIIHKNIIKNKNVLDLYSGVGTLGINVCDISKTVYGIEIIKNAVLNSITNSKINNVFNTKYMLGDAAKVINKINDNIDVIIVDPPRNGLLRKEIDSIIKINPQQIFYVSCDPITLSRDLNLLCNNYNISKIIGLDMFPYTYHCESVCILERR